MEAQRHSQSTTFSEKDSSTIINKDDKQTKKSANTVSAKYESDIAVDDYKKVFSIIEKKLGKPSKGKKDMMTWESDAEAKDHYVISLKENAIKIDYSGTKKKSESRKKILKLIVKITKLNQK
ncbi:hypothetical protein [Kordia sp.]|uniref:hypothetical protein n=1 Tax=Kordia sp. TaxID=1965332 RepID=UPI003D2A17C9